MSIFSLYFFCSATFWCRRPHVDEGGDDGGDGDLSATALFQGQGREAGAWPIRCARKECGKTFLVVPKEGKERFLRDRLTRSTYACDLECARSACVRERLAFECSRRNLPSPELLLPGATEHGEGEIGGGKGSSDRLYDGFWRQIVR